MKTWIASWKPYFSLYRLKAMQETQYRAAALGGLVTQAFFGLLYVFLYTALFRGENQAELAETITYVWLQQMFFRVLLMNDTELIQQVMTGGLAYAVLRPVDQYRFAFVRNMALPEPGCHFAPQLYSETPSPLIRLPYKGSSDPQKMGTP